MMTKTTTKIKVEKASISNTSCQSLIDEIQKLEELDYEAKLNGEGRMRKKLLIDRFNSLRKARRKAGLEDIELPPFDPEALAQKKRMKKAFKLPPMPSGPLRDDVPSGLPPFFRAESFPASF